MGPNAEAALDRADRGECGPVEGLVRRADLPEASRLAACAALAGLDPGVVPPPSPEALAACPPHPHRTRAALDMQALAFARLDEPAARAFAAVAATDPLAADLVDLRQAALAGRADPAAAEALAARARAEGRAATGLEATSLQALAHLAAEEVREGLRAARRASRMARTEGLVRQEYLANLVLVRARRYTGAPHAAARILAALGLVSPPGWRPWLSWEWLLLGRVSVALRTSSAPATTLWAALSDGRSAPDLPGMLAREAALWVEAVRPDAPALHPWIRGQADLPPAALRGAALDLDPARDRPANVIVRRAAAEGRRVLLLDRHAPSDELLARVGPAEQERAHALLAALILAPDAHLSVEAAHRRVFGTAYEAEIHDGALRTLLYRSRRLLDGRAGIDRTPFGLRLRGDAIAWDPRAAPGPEQRVLALLAGGERLGAKEIARALDAPLRSVQAGLRTLVEDERCATERVGRQVRYYLEDTTFYEPTLSRLHPTGHPVR